jgi:integrase
VTRSTFGHAWSATRASGGLPAGTGFHALRHHFATLLISSGASVKTVQLALGHSSPMVTLNTYAGLWPDAVDRTRNLVDAAFATPAEAVASC